MSAQSAQAKYDHIEGLNPREPVGAALTIGVKGPKGNPTDTDRFYFVLPHDQNVGGQRVRPLHPAFAAFNAAAPELRQMIRGNLVHARREDCFVHRLTAQVLPRHEAHPQKRPACSGDGVRATRYMGTLPDGSERWDEIVCPNNLCEFRVGRGPKPCKPSMQFLFRPSWRGNSPLPTPLVKLTSHSWYSTAAFLGFFEHVEAQARALGLTSWSLYGLPFTLTLTHKTKPQEQARFPVLAISPEVDLIQFFLAQAESVRKLGGAPLAALPASLADPELADPDLVASDFAAIRPGRVAAKPSNAEEIEAELVEPAREDAPGATISQEPDRDPSLLSSAAVARILAAAEAKGIDRTRLSGVIGAELDAAPAGVELEILRKIAQYRAPKGRAS